jgi:hypothetical protein
MAGVFGSLAIIISSGVVGTVLSRKITTMQNKVSELLRLRRNEWEPVLESTEIEKKNPQPYVNN